MTMNRLHFIQIVTACNYKRQSAEEDDVVYKAVKAALASGYRHIDTAAAVSLFFK